MMSAALMPIPTSASILMLTMMSVVMTAASLAVLMSAIASDVSVMIAVASPCRL